MALSKRERVIRTLELEEPDMVPVHNLGFEKTARAYQSYLNSEEFAKFQNNATDIEGFWLNMISEYRFHGNDTFSIDPFNKLKLKSYYFDYPSDFNESDLIMNFKDEVNYLNLKVGDTFLFPLSGIIFKIGMNEVTGKPYGWYLDGGFKHKSFILEVWDKYGKPIDYLNEEETFDPKVWDHFVDTLSPYLYPMGTGAIPMYESLMEGMSIGRLAYFMRRDPQFIHMMMGEFTKVNIEIIKRLSEAGADIFMYFDDLGQKNRTLISMKNFREFILPYYKMIYQEAKKRGMFFVHHSCGFVDKFLPDLVDAGLSCIQALEPAAGVDLANLKKTLGDKLAFMGGLDSSRTLNFGTSKEIEEDVKKCIKAAGQGGGYFVGPSHNILDTPWENVLAMRDAIEKYRKYPLQV
jgi:hypothetical protein